MTINKLTPIEMQKIFVELTIDVLAGVEQRFFGKEEISKITAVLTNLISNKNDIVMLNSALVYCADGWVFGSTD